MGLTKMHEVKIGPQNEKQKMTTRYVCIFANFENNLIFTQGGRVVKNSRPKPMNMFYSTSIICASNIVNNCRRRCGFRPTYLVNIV